MTPLEGFAVLIVVALCVSVLIALPMALADLWRTWRGY